MARLVTIPYEIGVGSANGFLEAAKFTTGTGTVALDATTLSAAPSRGSYKCAAVAGTDIACALSDISTVLGRKYFFRNRIQVSRLPTSTTQICNVQDGVGTYVCSVRLTSAGKLQLWNDVANSQIGSDSAYTVTASTWFRLDLSCTLGTGSIDTAEARVDGTVIATGTSLALSDQVIDYFQVGFISAPGVAMNLWVDDGAVNDDQGASETSYPGDAYVALLKPTADSSVATFTNGTGGGTGLWDATNNTPPVGVATANLTATSQIKSVTSNTTGQFTATLETYTAAGVPSDATVVLVQALAAIASGTTTAQSFGLSMVTNPAITEATKSSLAAAAAAWDTGWTGFWIGPAYAPTVTLGTAPTLKIRQNTASTVAKYACFMGVVVEVTLATSTPKSSSDTNSTTTEANGALKIAPATEANSTTTETNVPNAQLSSTDVNALAVEVAAIIRNASDLNSGVTETNAVNIQSSDTNGAAVEFQLLAVATPGDANGTTTETNVLTAAPASTDTNTSTIESASIRFTTADANGGVVETTQVLLSGSDVNAGIAETTGLGVVGADTNASTVEGASLRLTGADVNAGIVETGVPTVAISNTDVNGGEVETTGLGVFGTDANATTTESVSEVVLLASSDANVAPTEVPVVNLTSSDTNSTTTETGVISFSVFASDTNGSIAEAFSLNLSEADSATSAEGFALTALIPSADLNSGTVENASVFFTSTDANGGIAEIASLIVKVPDSDSGSTSETSAVTHVAATNSDIGTGMDTGTVSFALITSSDLPAFIGSDAVLTVSLESGDVAYGIDNGSASSAHTYPIITTGRVAPVHQAGLIRSTAPGQVDSARLDI